MKKRRKKHHYYDYMDHGIFFASMVYHSLYCVFTVLIFTIDPCLTKSQEIIPQILDILQSQKKKIRFSLSGWVKAPGKVNTFQTFQNSQQQKD